MRPLNDKIIVEPEEVPSKTVSGIILPEVNKDKFIRAKVLSVGPKVEDIHVGDTVLYDRHAGFEIESEGVMIRELDVQVKIIED